MAASKGSQIPVVQRTYAGVTDTLNQARQDLVDLLGENRLDALCADAQLIVSELTSNAVHASPGLPYQVTTKIDAEYVVISVVNQSSATLPDEDDWRPETVLAPQGRGLSIVKALSEHVDVVSTPSQVEVSAHLRIAST